MHENNPQQAMYGQGFPVEELLQTKRWPHERIEDVDGPVSVMLGQIAAIQKYFPLPEMPNLTDDRAESQRLEAGNTTHYALYKLAVTLQTWGLSHEGRIADSLVSLCKDAQTWLGNAEEKLSAVEDPEFTPDRALLPFQLVPGRGLFAGMLGEYAQQHPDEAQNAYDGCHKLQAEAYRAALHRYVQTSDEKLGAVRQEVCSRIPERCVTVRQEVATDAVDELEKHMRAVRAVTAQAVVQGRHNDQEAVQFLKQTEQAVASLLEKSKTDPRIRQKLGELLIREDVAPTAANMFGKARELFMRYMVDGLHNALVREADVLTSGDSRKGALMPVRETLPKNSEQYDGAAVAYAQKVFAELVANGAKTVDELYSRALKRLHPDQSGMTDTFSYLKMLYQEDLLKAHLPKDGQQKTAQQ